LAVKFVKLEVVGVVDKDKVLEQDRVQDIL
jgi:hypothetical protein